MSASPSGCHCLCFRNHAEQEGICTGAEDQRLTFYLEGEPWHVPMCVACIVATLAAHGDASQASMI